MAVEAVVLGTIGAGLGIMGHVPQTDKAEEP